MSASPRLLGSLARWTARAKQEGLSAEQIRMLLEVALDESPESGEGSAAGSVT